MMLSTSLDLPEASGKALGLGAARMIGETFRRGVDERLVFKPDGLCSAPEMAYGAWGTCAWDGVRRGHRPHRGRRGGVGREPRFASSKPTSLC